MRGLLLLLLSLSILSAEIMVYASQIPDSSSVRYSVQQMDVSGGHLQLTLKRGNTQVMVTDVQGFNGAASGFLSVGEAGTYTLAAYERTTGEYGEAEFEFTPPRPAPEERPPTQMIPGVPDYLFWLALVIAAVLVFLLIFGNPMAQKPRK